MPKLRQPSLLALCLLLLTSGLTGCGALTPVPTATATLPPPVTATPTAQAVVSQPGTPPIQADQLERLEQIAQWGSGNVNGIALSPDGNLIAVSTTTGIYLYDRKTAQQVDYLDLRLGAEIEPQACSTSGNLAFSPDSSTLAIAETEITLWDLKTSTVRQVLKNQIPEPASLVTEIQFSLDGSRLFGIQKTASGYPCYAGWGSLVMYAVETGKLIFRRDYSRYEEGPKTRFYEQDGRVLILSPGTHQPGRSIFEVDLQTGASLGERPTPELFDLNDATGLTYQWVNQGQSGEGYSETHLVDLASFKDLEVLKAEVGLIPHSNRLIQLEAQELTVRTLAGEVTCSQPVDAVAATSFLPERFSADGSVAISWNSYGFQAGEVRIWDLERCLISEPILNFPEVARQLSFSADGRSVLTGSRAGYTFHVFDTNTGRLRFSLPGFDAQFNADGEQVFVVEAQAIQAYAVDTGQFLGQVLENASDYMTEILVSPNGKFLAINDTPSRESRIIGLDQVSWLGVRPGILYHKLHFSRDGKLMAEITNELGGNQLRFWDLETGNELSQRQGRLPTTGPAEIAFNSDFTQAATLGTDGYYQYVYLWDAQKLSLDKVLTQPYPRSKRPIRNLAFMPEDRLLIARGIDPDAWLFWEVQTGKLLAELPAEIHLSELGNPMAFSPAGNLILSVDGDGTLHVWGIP